MAGFTVGITAARRRTELGTALAAQGARVRYGPALTLITPMADEELRAATAACLAGPVDLVVLTTGAGVRAWLDAAVFWGFGDALIATLQATTVVTRGPRTAAAARAAGLPIAHEAEASVQLLEYLLDSSELAGRRVAVQLHGELLRELASTLRAQGAEVIEVPVYRWVPPEDPEPLRLLIEEVATESIDALAFTSAPAAVSFLRTSDSLGLLADVTAALNRTVLCACVGPVTAVPLQNAGIPVVLPARTRLDALAAEIIEQLPRRAPRLRAAGHDLEVRGHAVVLDDELVMLPAGSMALLRELVRRPGQVLSRGALAPLLPGEGSEGHAVEVAIGRLRLALGDPALVQTVVKRGYRLGVDPGTVASRARVVR
ncbi:MAG: Uroporphyrinogen synthase [Jatrophihabitans sp.]|nr:Uroporphyrinogen synthase [Jatrophihabitans sp.]